MTRRTELTGENHPIGCLHYRRAQERMLESRRGTVLRCKFKHRQRERSGVFICLRRHSDVLPTIPVDGYVVRSAVTEMCLRKSIAKRICRAVVALAEAADDGVS